MSPFEETTSVEPLGDGRYRCTLDPEWTTYAGVNGGILMAILARAVKHRVGADRQLRSLQVQFLRPPAATEAEVRLELIREGRRATNLRAEIRQGEKVVLLAQVTCMVTGMREIIRWSPPMPDLTPFGDAEAMSLDPRSPSLASKIEYRPLIGPAPLSGTPLEPGQPARTGGWWRTTTPAPVDEAMLVFAVDAWWPPALGPIDQVAFTPSVDMTVHLRADLPPEGLPPQPLALEISTAAVQDGLLEEDARVFTADGTLLAQARQMAIVFTPDDRAPGAPQATS